MARIRGKGADRRFSDDELEAAWRGSSSVAEAAERLGASPGNVRMWADALRGRGRDLVDLPERLGTTGSCGGARAYVVPRELADLVAAFRRKRT